MTKLAANALVVLLASAALAACATPAATGPATVTLTDDGCGRSGPETLSTGSITLEVRNESGGLGNFEMLRLDGSFVELVAYVAEEQARIAAGQPPLGTPATVTEVGRLLLNPIGTGVLEATLTAGTYAIVCAQLIASEDVVLNLFLVGPYSATDNP